MFYPPKGTEGGPIVFTYVLICLRKGILDFQFSSGNLPFWNHQNVLSPEGTLHSRVPKEVQLFLLMFFCLRKGILDFQNPNFQAAFLKS